MNNHSRNTLQQGMSDPSTAAVNRSAQADESIQINNSRTGLSKAALKQSFIDNLN
ncbi:MAG: hypothetical protein AAGC54_12545 [Cyanobacteria bacterium P01_F01_bin.4]